MDLFTMHGRINRARYIGHALLLPSIFLIYILIDPLLEKGGRLFSIIGAMLFLAFLMTFVVLDISLTVRRLHDLNKSGAHFWFLFVPFYNIYLSLILLFRKGTDGPNQYGDDPLSTFNTEHTLIKLEKEHISFRLPNKVEQIMMKGSISAYELNDRYNIEGRDSNGTIVIQNIPRKSLGIRSKYFLYRLSEYLTD